MYKIDQSHGGHKWDKENLVTQSGGGKTYDVLKCACGIKGRAYSLYTISIPGTYSKARIDRCSLLPKTETGRIRITYCTASGKAFGNLTPGSEHDIIEPPAGENSVTGVWVMGVGEPVKVLHREYRKL